MFLNVNHAPTIHVPPHLLERVPGYINTMFDLAGLGVHHPDFEMPDSVDPFVRPAGFSKSWALRNIPGIWILPPIQFTMVNGEPLVVFKPCQAFISFIFMQDFLLRNGMDLTPANVSKVRMGYRMLHRHEIKRMALRVEGFLPKEGKGREYLRKWDSNKDEIRRHHIYPFRSPTKIDRLLSQRFDKERSLWEPTSNHYGSVAILQMLRENFGAIPLSSAFWSFTEANPEVEFETGAMIYRNVGLRVQQALLPEGRTQWRKRQEEVGEYQRAICMMLPEYLRKYPEKCLVEFTGPPKPFYLENHDKWPSHRVSLFWAHPKYRVPFSCRAGEWAPFTTPTPEMANAVAHWLQQEVLPYYVDTEKVTHVDVSKMVTS